MNIPALDIMRQSKSCTTLGCVCLVLNNCSMNGVAVSNGRTSLRSPSFVYSQEVSSITSIFGGKCGRIGCGLCA
jgi:hypothetical protein